MRYSFEIKELWDVDAVVHRVKKNFDFKNNIRDRSLIILKELSTNMVKYAGGGKLKIFFTDDMIRISAEDEGPGIRDQELAKKDGFAKGEQIVSEKGIMKHIGLGSGLPAVCRLADEVDISSDENGTSITAYIENGN